MLSTLWQYFKDVFLFAAYVSTTNSFPEPLSTEEERKYLEEYEKGNEQARAKLIEHNLRLVAHIAKKYAQNGRDSDDIISIGTIGLIKAVNTFSQRKGASLGTYAAKCIENEILMSLRSEKKQLAEVSLQDAIGTDRDGNEISLVEILGADDTCVQNEVELRLDTEKLYQTMEKVLTERERLVISLRYGIMGGYAMAQREIAEMLGISRSYISRIEKKAIGKLNAVMQEDKSKLTR